MPLQLRNNTCNSVRLNLERCKQFFLPSRLRPHYFFSPQFMEELLKREGSKSRGGGISFLFVFFVGLLGIILGYLMKRT